MGAHRKPHHDLFHPPWLGLDDIEPEENPCGDATDEQHGAGKWRWQGDIWRSDDED